MNGSTNQRTNPNPMSAGRNHHSQARQNEGEWAALEVLKEAGSVAVALEERLNKLSTGVFVVRGA